MPYLIIDIVLDTAYLQSITRTPYCLIIHGRHRPQSMSSVSRHCHHQISFVHVFVGICDQVVSKIHDTLLYKECIKFYGGNGCAATSLLRIVHVVLYSYCLV